MGARQFAAVVVLALLQACAIEQPVSGAVSLTGEWTTVTPPEPLRVARNEQKVCLHVDAVRDIDLQNGVILENGQRHVLEGEAVDSEGAQYVLEVGGLLQGDNVCLYRGGGLGPGPDFPEDRTIVRFRFRSNPPLQVGKVRWFSLDPR
jgi:hypothetical protein